MYLDETLADVTGAQSLVTAGGERQRREEEEERGGGGRGGMDQLTRPHPDGSPARHWNTYGDDTAQVVEISTSVE